MILTRCPVVHAFQASRHAILSGLPKPFYSEALKGPAILRHHRTFFLWLLSDKLKQGAKGQEMGLTITIQPGIFHFVRAKSLAGFDNLQLHGGHTASLVFLLAVFCVRTMALHYSWAGRVGSLRARRSP